MDDNIALELQELRKSVDRQNELQEEANRIMRSLTGTLREAKDAVADVLGEFKRMIPERHVPLAESPSRVTAWSDRPRASGVDLKSGRPIVTEVFTGALEGKNVTVWPSISGVTNWQHMSFSPRTGLLYINTIHVGMN